MTPGHPEWGILRILAARPGKPVPVGAGFLVSDRYALTCAHVVNESLGLDPFADARPDSPVFFDLPAASGATPLAGPLTAQVIAWCPAREEPRQGEPDDIAVLMLDRPQAGDHALALLPPDSPVTPGRQGHAYGFPERGDSGIWAKGELSGHQHVGWRQVDDLGGTAIDAGFSGCPFLDAAQEHVLGMVVARHNRFRVSYLIPVATLLQAWEGLAAIARMADPPKPAGEVADTTPAVARIDTGGAAYVGGNQSTGGGDAVGRDQTKIVITNVISVPGAPRQPEETAPALVEALERPDDTQAADGPPTLTLQVDCIGGTLCVEALRPLPTPAHTTPLADLRPALDGQDHEALFRALFASPHQLAELVAAAGGNPRTDDPITKPLRLRLVCSGAEAAVLPWHCLGQHGRRLAESGWVVEVLPEADGDALTIALDNPLVVAPSDATLPIGARTHATSVRAYLRRLLADCHTLVPWVSTGRELDAALDKEPDLIYLFAQVDAQGAFILGKDDGRHEAYPLGDLVERLKRFRDKPLVWLHLVAGSACAERTAAELWERLRPVTRLLLVQLTTQGKAPGSLASTLEWMGAMADGREEPAAVISRLAGHRGTHLWLGGRSLRLSPCSDTDAALLGYIRASLIRLMLGRMSEKRLLGSGILEKPSGYLTLYGVCGDAQACVHDLPEQARHYIEAFDRHTIVETRPLPLTMRAGPAVRDEVARQLIQDLSISAIMPALDALRHIPVVPPDREDTLIVALSWLLEPAADFTPDLLAGWLTGWKQGLLDVLEKEQIPPDFRLLVSACIQWPDGWPERHGTDALALQRRIDRVLKQGNPADYVHRIEMKQPLSLLSADDLDDLYREQRLKDRLRVKGQDIDRLVDYILERTGGRFQDTVDLIYSECKQHYAGFRDSLKGP
jgi:hypothetical protein